MKYLLPLLLLGCDLPPHPDCPVGGGCHVGTWAEREFSRKVVSLAGGNYDGVTFEVVRTNSEVTAHLEDRGCISGYATKNRVVSTPAALAHEMIHLDIMNRKGGNDGIDHNIETGWTEEDTVRGTWLQAAASDYEPYETVFDCEDQE